MTNRYFLIALLMATFFLLPSIITVSSQQEDMDFITVTIKTIRSLEKEDLQVHFKKIIDKKTDPDFYIKVWIDDELFVSDVYWNTKYLYNLNWQVSKKVSSDTTRIPIRLQLWDAADEDIKEDRLCDLNQGVGNSVSSKEVNLIYDMNTGQWEGDDYRGDPSGYGRLNGCDDGSIYVQELDVELWFVITQADPDGDGIPSWVETNVYGTDPYKNDTGLDSDNDGIPIEWEWRWGYDPFTWDNHSSLDPDDDSITNWEEYYMRNWSSDPYRIDLFVEMDQMIGPNGEPGMFPEGGKEILFTAFDRQNIVFHLDDGRMGRESRADLIPFDELTECFWNRFDELDEIYETYFLNQPDGNIRRGIFHYGVVIYQSSLVNGNIFGPNRFQISARGMEEKFKNDIFLNDKDVIYASAYMHELGHTFNFHPIPGHNKYSYYPWQIGFWLSRAYKSCMNYGYMYYTVDYSDGSHGFNDYNDWERRDLSYFEKDW